MRYKNHLLLLLTAFIWGCAFVAQSAGMNYVGPFTFTALRSYLGGLVLLPLIYFFDHTMDFKDKKLWAGGIACGIVLGLASALQQFGIQYTTVGKAGFITALYIIVVPFFSLFLGKKLSPKIGISVVLAVIGLYLLCMTGSLSLGKGDLLVCACACVFALHILVIDHYSPLVDGVKMSCIQFFTCALLNTIPMFLFEDVSMHNIMVGCAPILKWSRLYITDYWTEGYESYSSFYFVKYGICILSTCRMGDLRSESYNQRRIGLCTHVYCDYYCTVTRQKNHSELNSEWFFS